MAEQFLTLMADLDAQSQARMGAWRAHLEQAGFPGTQTPGLPFHISLAAFSPDQEPEVIREMHRLAKEFSSIPVSISHIGVFAGGRVLFGAPDMSAPGLLSLRRAIRTAPCENFPWAPHATILIDEAETVCRALPVLLEVFQPFTGKITGLHLCAFWPTREIGTVDLCGS